MSMKAARRSLPNFSSSALPCFAVRDGQVSMRKKITTVTIATINAISVKASGQETRAKCDWERQSTNDECRINDEAQILNDESNSIFRFRIQSGLRHLWPKNYRPPHPIECEGRLFPPEQS